MAAGRSAKDWTLILDDHKGAHTLELSLPSSAKAAGIGVSERPLQRLRITEHSKVFEFELCTHPRACAPLAACPSFQASCARASEAEARGGTGAPLPLGKGFGRPRRGKGVAPPPPSLGSLMGMGRAEIERRSRARWAGRHRASRRSALRMRGRLLVGEGMGTRWSEDVHWEPESIKHQIAYHQTSNTG